jgi:hypothetical protein
MDNSKGQDAAMYLNRKSNVKLSIRSFCDNQPLIQVLQDIVKKCRSFEYVASLFMEFLLVQGFANNEPIPRIDQKFCLRRFLSAYRSENVTPGKVY